MTVQRTFPAVPASVPAARRFVIDTAPGLPEATADTLALLVSELATNCLVHAGTGFRVTVDFGRGKIRVEVVDSGTGQARLRSPRADEPHGRGLRLVNTLSDEWGVVPSTTQDGKAVWFTLTVPSGSPASAASAASASSTAAQKPDQRKRLRPPGFKW